jgi:hypothetical protein
VPLTGMPHLIAATQQALAADRFAREILAILATGFDPQAISTYECGG